MERPADYLAALLLGGAKAAVRRDATPSAVFGSYSCRPVSRWEAAVKRAWGWAQGPARSGAVAAMSSSGSSATSVPFFSAEGVTVPVGVSVFADEIYRVPRSWAERAYPNLVHYTEHYRGGHFAAWEPQLLTEDVRARFRSLR